MIRMTTIMIRMMTIMIRMITIMIRTIIILEFNNDYNYYYDFHQIQSSALMKIDYSTEEA